MLNKKVKTYSENINENEKINNKSTKNKNVKTTKNNEKSSKKEEKSKTTLKKKSKTRLKTKKNINKTTKSNTNKSKVNEINNTTTNITTKRTYTKRKNTKINKDSKVSFQKIPNSLLNLLDNQKEIENCNNKEKRMIIILYIAILMNINFKYEYITTIEVLTKLCEGISNITKSNKENYVKALEILNDDIKIKNEVYISKLLDYNIFLKHQYNPNNKNITDSDILTIKLEQTYKDFTDNYTELYFKEYEYLININNKYKENHRKKIDLNTLISLYLYLKMMNNKYTNLKNKGIIDSTDTEDNNYYFISRKILSKNTSIPEGTIDNYIKILESYGLLEIRKGNYSDKKANEYKILKPWDA